MRALCSALALALAMAAIAPPASAESAADVAAARDLFREGSKLSAEGNWPDARDRFERSLKLKRAPITLYSLGVAQSHTGKLVEALENFRAFLNEPSAAATQRFEEPAREAIAALEKRVGRVSISIEPTGLKDLKVRIGEEPVPPVALGVPRLVNPGTHEVNASATGYLKGQASFTVAEGGTSEVSLVLRPGSEPTKAAAIPPIVKPKPLPPEAPSRVLPISLIAGGGALIVGGVVVGMLGVAQANDATTSDGPDASAARTKSIVGDVMAGVGIGAAAVGVFLLIIRKPAPPPKVGHVAASSRGFRGVTLPARSTGTEAVAFTF